MIPENVYYFQKDIRNGMSIAEALTKHGLTLEKAFNTLQYQSHSTRKKPRKKYTFTGQKYITHHQGKYIIRKSQRKKMRYYGGYDTLDDAIHVRDYLNEYGWTRANVNRIRKELNYDRL